MTREEFEELFSKALDELPKIFQEKLENVAVTVDDWPTREQLDSLGTKPPSTLFGLYHGVPKNKRGSYYSSLPDKITIFAGPILNSSTTPESIKERVKQVVQHEIAHHFGFSEEMIRETENK
ncbi:MAG: metallopeptidase family protein [bacterium]|nr:metallopeptidase family protein [bacterium]